MIENERFGTPVAFRQLYILVGLGFIASVVFVDWWMLSNPRVVLLISRNGAKWIRVDEPIDLNARTERLVYAVFRAELNVPKQFSGGVLRVCALRRVAVSIDRTRIFDTGEHVRDWKQVYSLPLPANLTPGPHRLQTSVANLEGPCLVRVDCRELGIKSGRSWEASIDRTHWRPAALASDPLQCELENRFGPAYRDVLGILPLLIFLFGAGFGLGLRGAVQTADRDYGQWARWILLAAWLVLIVNNLFKVPSYVGYDAADHLAYIQYVAEHWRVPFPDEGWQFFQTPVYYFFSAVVYRLILALGAGQDQAITWIHVVPLACGAALVEICFRIARQIFPGQSALQALTIVIGGLLPMNIYMAQSLSNEPMAACACGVLILIALRFLKNTAPDRLLFNVILCGAVLGFAVLVKVSAVVWILPVCGAIVFGMSRWEYSTGRILRSLAIFFIAGALVSGWYFVRNVIHGLPPFFSHSKIGQAIWWQDPGYRTPGQLIEFGHVFAGPVYSGLRCFWDSIYSTMWADGLMSGISDFDHRAPFNYPLMSCSIWLGVVPTLAFIIAACNTVWRSFGKNQNTTDHRVQWFCIVSIACFLAAIMYVYLTLPIYSCAKASYMLGATPCLAILGGAGFNLLRPYRIAWAIAMGLLTCWAATAYLTYLVL